jgi:hypothetical protein
MVRGRIRTRSTIRRSPASFTSRGASPSSSVPTMASLSALVHANARRSRSRPFFQLSLPRNKTSGCRGNRSTSVATWPSPGGGSSTPFGMTASWGNRQPKRWSSAATAAACSTFDLSMVWILGFGKTAAPTDQVPDQHAPWQEHVRNASLARRAGCRPRRPQKD